MFHLFWFRWFFRDPLQYVSSSTVIRSPSLLSKHAFILSSWWALQRLFNRLVDCLAVLPIKTCYCYLSKLTLLMIPIENNAESDNTAWAAKPTIGRIRQSSTFKKEMAKHCRKEASSKSSQIRLCSRVLIMKPILYVKAVIPSYVSSWGCL